MGVVRNLFDGLTNALTGAGTTTDPRSYNRYFARPLTDPEIDAAYRGSWVMRKIIDKPATEMVREWRDWQADADDIEKLEAEEKRLDLRNAVKRAEILRGLGGGAIVLWVDDADQSQPLKPESVRAGGLEQIHVWHRSRFNLGPMIETWGDPWFGHPSYYEVNLTGAAGNKAERFHPSRVVAFKAEHVSDIVSTGWHDHFWGQSKVQTVMDAVQNVDTAENGFAALIKDARNRRLGVPGLTTRLATTTGEQEFSRRVAAMAMGESMFGVTFYDSGNGEGKGGETIDDRQMVWAGIPDIKASYWTAAAAAGDMPGTVLWGLSPQGMSATGDSDRLIWENTIKARQDLDCSPCMAQIDAALIPSALGKVDPAIWYEWAPLSTLNEKDEATAFYTTMQAMEKLQTSASIPDIAYSKGMQNLVVERGWVPGLDTALAAIPESERFPDGEPELDANGNPIDPSAIASISNGGKEADPKSLPSAGTPPNARRRAANDARFADATPRTLYVSRAVTNVRDLQAWATKQGLGKLQDDLHVTIAYSTQPVDWMTVGGDDWSQEKDGTMLIPPGGVRIVQPLGDRTAVLLFTSSRLAWRHEQIVQAGASWEYPEYQPHISLTGEPVDLTGVEAYQGVIKLGPELFAEVRSEGLGVEPDA